MAINMVMKYCASLCSFSFYCREKWASRDWLKEKCICICICMEYISIIFGPIAQKNKQAFWNRINKYFITPDTFNTQGHACSQEDIISRRKEERGFLYGTTAHVFSHESNCLHHFLVLCEIRELMQTTLRSYLRLDRICSEVSSYIFPLLGTSVARQ